MIISISKMNILKYSNFSVLRHGKLYKIDVCFPNLQVEGGCHVSGKVKEFPIDERCSFVETFREQIHLKLYHYLNRIFVFV